MFRLVVFRSGTRLVVMLVMFSARFRVGILVGWAMEPSMLLGGLLAKSI